MRALKFVAPLGLAIACVAGNSIAQNQNIITLQNRDAAKAVSVDVRVGTTRPNNAAGGDCSNLPTARTFVIKPQSTETLTITGERWACLRLTGTPGWRQEPLAGGKDYSFYVN